MHRLIINLLTPAQLKSMFNIMEIKTGKNWKIFFFNIPGIWYAAVVKQFLKAAVNSKAGKIKAASLN